MKKPKDVCSASEDGKHDWGYKEELDEGEIYHLTRKDSNFAIVGGTKYWKRVCLLCFKCEDTITPRIAEEKRDQEAHTKREKLTETLWKKYGEKR
jgi:hypothetical protein